MIRYQIKRSMSALFSLLLFSVGMKAQDIPLNPEVKTGTLPNGLTYYVQHNEEPKGQAHLLLVNKVGSILEDDDQQGLAHFMEHMNFNGTTNFPNDRLVEVLELAGVQFGADLNAYTGFDETVYMLPIPLAQPGMLDTGMAVLRDWASEATLDPTEIDKERGVILEEERMHRGAGDRIQKKVYPILTNKSRYSQRVPIGKVDLLKTFPHDAIVRFYKDWYRPDLQAVVVVGDIDVESTVAKIKEKFSDLENPLNARERVKHSIPLKGESQYAVIKDPQQANVSLQMVFKKELKPIKTEDDYKEAIKRILMNQMLRYRSYEKSNADIDPVYMGFNIGSKAFLSNVEMMEFSVSADTAKFKAAFYDTWTWVERIKQVGFTQQDLDQAKRSFLQSMIQSQKEQKHITSKSFANEYKNVFLKGEAAPGIDWECAFVEAQLPTISLEAINDLFNRYLQPKNRDLIIYTSDQYDFKLPSQEEINRWINEIAGQEMTAFDSEDLNQPLIEHLPLAGKVISIKDKDEVGVKELKLSNGVKVVLKPTTFSTDQIIFSGYSEGGSSLYEGDDYINASNAVSMISGMGLGNYSPVALSKKLNSVQANVSVGLTAHQQQVSGSSSVEDFETALKLTYLKFTAPRTDSVLFAKTIHNAKESLKNRYLVPGNVLSDTISYVMGNYDERTKPFSEEQLAALNLKRMEQIYKERFADASGFTFVFVGNFTTDTIIPLLEKYIGALPASDKKEKSQDLKILPPKGKLVKKVYEEKEDKASVSIFIHGKAKYNYLDALKMNILGQSLQSRLLKVLREQEGEVYTPSSSASLSRGGEDLYQIQIGFVCSPDNVDHLIGLAEEQVKYINENGVTQDDLIKFKAGFEKNISQSMENNGFWLNYLVQQYTNKDKLDALYSYSKQVDQLECKDLNKVASRYFNTDNELIFLLLPKK